jgi:hypothetical protein
MITGRYTGGCLCGALRFEADGPPLFRGHCSCADCKKASGSGFIPFIGLPASAVRISGPSRRFTSISFRGGESVRTFCPTCGGLVFGGIIDKETEHTICAVALDEPFGFEPKLAIFNRDRPAWVILPAGITVFESMPPA